MHKEMNALLPQTIEILITEEMIRHYADVSRDWNPVHFSKTAAEQAGYPEKVAHGMLTMAISTRLVSPLLGEGMTVQAYQMKFSAPVYVNDLLTITGSQSAGNEVKVIGKKQDGQTAVQGRLSLAP